MNSLRFLAFSSAAPPWGKGRGWEQMMGGRNKEKEKEQGGQEERRKERASEKERPAGVLAAGRN